MVKISKTVAQDMATLHQHLNVLIIIVPKYFESILSLELGERVQILQISKNIATCIVKNALAKCLCRYS